MQLESSSCVHGQHKHFYWWGDEVLVQKCRECINVREYCPLSHNVLPFHIQIYSIGSLPMSAEATRRLVTTGSKMLVWYLRQRNNLCQSFHPKKCLDVPKTVGNKWEECFCSWLAKSSQKWFESLSYGFIQKQACQPNSPMPTKCPSKLVAFVHISPISQFYKVICHCPQAWFGC